MPSDRDPFVETLPRDLAAGVVVFLVALPLCLGVALASGAPLFAGLVSGIVGGILVGLLSGSQTSVSGPAAGLTAVVAAQITSLGSFQTFLLAVVLAGVLQIIVGACRGGFIASFVPSSVIKGLLAAIGVILILKQIPHVFGHDDDPEGDMAFFQPDQQNTFSEILAVLSDLHPAAAIIGLGSVIFLAIWTNIKALKKLPVPAELLVVVIGVAATELFRRAGGGWVIGVSHCVEVPIAGSFEDFFGFLKQPDFSQLGKSAVYIAAFT
ncbi:MAG: SulP family inorganic anion transporter, partial [Gemmataceae bacterium]